MVAQNRAWIALLRTAVEHPNRWHRSHRYFKRLHCEARFTGFGLWIVEAFVTKHIPEGTVGTWHYTHGICEDGIGFYYYMWVKFVPDGSRRIGPPVPEEALRFKSWGRPAGPFERVPKRTYKKRRLVPSDVRTKRSDGHS